MRRLGLVFVASGMFLILLAGLVRFVAAPMLAKSPLDLYSTSVSSGTATYFNLESREEVGPTPVSSTRTVRGDVAAGTGDVAVYDSFSTIEDEGAQAGVITASTERFAIDRRSGEAVNCCDEDPVHRGLIIKFPFGTEPRDYDLWDGTAGDAYPAIFEGTEQLNGLDVLKFSQTIPPKVLSNLTVGGDLVGDPEGGNVEADVVYETYKELWVEPATGIIVNGTQKASQTVQYEGRVLIQGLVGDFAFSDEQVADNVDFARSQRSLLGLLESTGPLVALILGVLALAGGFVLTSRHQT